MLVLGDIAELEFVEAQGPVEVYRDKQTGEAFYLGRTQRDAPPAHFAATIQRSAQSLFFEVLEAAEAAVPPSRRQVEGYRERAQQLIKEAQGSESSPLLMVLGISARLLERWSEAVTLFQRVTVLNPRYLSAWLELTWAFAMLQRFDEAEPAARSAVALDPDGAASLCNLGAVLFQQGRLEEARTAAGKALQADPKDKQTIPLLQSIEKAASRASAPERRKGWWQFWRPT